MAGMDESIDYYELLEVSRGCTPDELKRAYRRLARELHPDTNPDPEAEARFKQVALAYETLSDPERRQRYDRFGPEGAAGGGGPGFGGGLGDLFDAFFGGGGPFGGGGAPAGPPRGADLEQVIDLSFEEAVFGTQAPVTVRTAVPCDDCEATGAAPGTTVTTCPECGGVGQVQRVRQSLLGQMVTTGLCPRCGGAGTFVESPCPSCRGDGRIVGERTFTVDVPAGIDSGSTLRLTGRGAVGPRGGPLGDLYVHVRVRPHDRFTRQGYDLAHELHVSSTRRRWARRWPSRRSTASRTWSCRGAPRPAASSASGTGACPTSRVGAAATCWCRWWWTRPPTSTSRRRRCCASWPSCAASRSRPPRPGSWARSARRSSRRWPPRPVARPGRAVPTAEEARTPSSTTSSDLSSTTPTATTSSGCSGCDAATG